MSDISFLQCQHTRTRLATDQSVEATTNAVKDAFERCADVEKWQEGPYDFYVESEAGRDDEGYRANVSVHERDDRTHVLVDASPLLFHGSAHDDRRRAEGWNLNVRHDHFHDVLMTAIVAALTDTPERRVTAETWEPRSDDGIAGKSTTQHMDPSGISPATASADRPPDERDDEPHYLKEVSDREQESYSTSRSPNIVGIAIAGLWGVAFVSLPVAFAISPVLGFFAAVAGVFLVLVAVAIHQENATQSASE